MRLPSRGDSPISVSDNNFGVSCVAYFFEDIVTFLLNQQIMYILSGLHQKRGVEDFAVSPKTKY